MNMRIWMVLILGGLGTFLFRYVFIALGERMPDPQKIQKLLRLIPASVMAALACSGLFVKHGHVSTHWDPRLGAAILAAWVAYRYRNLLATIVVGMVSLYALHGLQILMR